MADRQQSICIRQTSGPDWKSDHCVGGRKSHSHKRRRYGYKIIDWIEMQSTRTFAQQQTACKSIYNPFCVRIFGMRILSFKCVALARHTCDLILQWQNWVTEIHSYWHFHELDPFRFWRTQRYPIRFHSQYIESKHFWCCENCNKINGSRRKWCWMRRRNGSRRRQTEGYQIGNSIPSGLFFYCFFFLCLDAENTRRISGKTLGR